MGRISFNELDNYKSSGNANYFKLENDGDSALVRFMYNGIDDVEGTAVHTIPVEGSQWGRDVNCLRAYNEPVDECPLCKAGYGVKAKIFVPLYNVDDDEVQIWTRSKGYGSVLSSLISHDTKKGNSFVNNIYSIERKGKKGDKQTTYREYLEDTDETELEDLPEAPDPIGTVVMDKSFDELQYYVDNGEFPDKDSKPVRRRGSRRDEEDEEVEEEKPRRRTERRTPANRRRNDEDTF